jgi:hypothetical protein
MLTFLKGLISPITAIAVPVIQGWTARKSAKLESDLRVNEAVTEAKIEKVKTAQTADIAWENLSIQNAGWKDEFLLIVFSTPLIMSFIPFLQPFVVAGFVALSTTPLWYQSAIGVMVASAYGYRKFVDVMNVRKGD